MQTLRLFVDVARCHSFSEAAAQHGITQSAASQRISHLEKKLGATLIDRSVRPLALTEAGKVFLNGCENLLEDYEQLTRRVARMEVQPRGTVRVAAIYSAGIEMLARIRERFEAEHDGISVQITYNQPQEVYQAVRDFACDLGIVSYPQRWRGVGVIPVRDELMSVVCGPGHELARRQEVSPADLSYHEMVTIDNDLPLGRRIRRYLHEHGAAVRIVNSFDNIDTIKSVLMVTERFSILPRRTVSREVDAGSLVSVTLEPRLVRPIGVIYRRRQKDGPVFSAASQAFVDYLLTHAGPGVDLTEHAHLPQRQMAGERL